MESGPTPNLLGTYTRMIGTEAKNCYPCNFERTARSANEGTSQESEKIV